MTLQVLDSLRLGWGILEFKDMVVGYSTPPGRAVVFHTSLRTIGSEADGWCQGFPSLCFMLCHPKFWFCVILPRAFFFSLLSGTQREVWFPPVPSQFVYSSRIVSFHYFSLLYFICGDLNKNGPMGSLIRAWCYLTGIRRCGHYWRKCVTEGKIWGFKTSSQAQFHSVFYISTPPSSSLL